jgi:hypothetical protein
MLPSVKMLEPGDRLAKLPSLLCHAMLPQPIVQAMPAVLGLSLSCAKCGCALSSGEPFACSCLSQASDVPLLQLQHE